MFQTGLVSVSFRPLTVDQIMDLCVENDLRYVEWGSDIHAPCDDGERLAYLAAEQKRKGLICSSYGTYYHGQRIAPNTPTPVRVGSTFFLGSERYRFTIG